MVGFSAAPPTYYSMLRPQVLVTLHNPEWKRSGVSGDLARANTVAVAQETKEDSLKKKLKKTWCQFCGY